MPEPLATIKQERWTIRSDLNLRNLGIALIAIFAGLLCALAPWWVSGGVLVGIVVVVLVVRDPFFGLMLTLAFSAQAIPGALVPNIPLGGALILPCEIMLLLTLTSSLLNGISGRHPFVHVSRDFLIAALLSLGALLASIFVGKFVLGQKDFAFQVLRNFLPLTLLPLLPSILCNRRRIALAEGFFIAFGVLIALFIALQAFTSLELLTGRLEDLGRNQTTGVTRTVLWGPELLVILALFLIGRQGLRFCLSRLWPVPAVTILLLGLMGTYTRSFWVATLVAAVLLAVFAKGIKGGLRLAAIVVPIVVVLGAAVFVVNPRIGAAAFDRAFGITKEIESGDSFGWRGKENAMAIEAIAKHPVLGIGFNGVYKPSISTHGHFEGEEIYIHNAYLYFQLKMGLFGAAILIAFLALYVRLARAAFSIADAQDRVSALSYVVLGVVVMMIGYSGQTISRFVTLLIVCLMFSIIKSYARHD